MTDSDVKYTNQTINSLILEGFTIPIYDDLTALKNARKFEGTDQNISERFISMYVKDDKNFNNAIINYEKSTIVDQLNNYLARYSTDYNNIVLFHGINTSINYVPGDKFGSYGYLSKTSDIDVATRFCGMPCTIMLCYYPGISKHLMVLPIRNEKEFLTLPGENFEVFDVKTINYQIPNTIKIISVKYIGQLPPHSKDNPVYNLYSMISKESDRIEIVLKNGQIINYSCKGYYCQEYILQFEPLYYNNQIKSIKFNDNFIYNNDQLMGGSLMKSDNIYYKKYLKYKNKYLNLI